jgi:hypothetical protein
MLMFMKCNALKEAKHLRCYRHGQRGSNIEECEGIKILGQEKHTSSGSKLMNF